MASGNVVSLADRILETLEGLATVKTRLAIGVGDEFEKFWEIIRSLRLVLPDAAEKARRSIMVAYWLKDLNDALHEADDAVDEFIISEIWRKRVATRGNGVVTKVCIFFPNAFNHFVFRRKLASVNERLVFATAQRDKFGLRHGSSFDRASLLARARSRLSLEVAEDDLIGRDSDLHKILEMLLGPHSEDQNVSIISLVGSAGLGKTSLARVAFNHERCRERFELRKWVDVSGDVDATRIADSILKHVAGRSVPSEDTEIELMLEKDLTGRKYLLVLDDVRRIDHEKWLDFKRLLMSGAEGSRVLLTTRSKEAAQIACTMPVFVLDHLDEEESWQLFERVAFWGQEPPSYGIVARRILRYCCAVPLIIKTVGNIMQEIGATDERECERYLDELRHEFLDEWIMEEGTEDILPALKLNFDRLPSHLKDCFAYCSLFPRGHEIDVQTLIKLWVAQQFVSMSHAEQSLEDLAYEHFTSLLGGNFFETVERDSQGKATKCKMSGVMHELATYAAGGECIELSLDDYHQNVRLVPRHVSFDFPLSSLRQIPTFSGAARVRSILFPCQSSIKQEGSSSRAICDTIISNMEYLRTLDLHDSGIETVPDSIDRLKHLRYLDLSRNVNIKVLSLSLTKLLYLQTLKLSLCFRLRELPRDIKNLVNLRHLEIDGCYNLTHMPRGLGLLTQLQTLSLFVLSKDAKSTSQHYIGQLNELGTLDNLRGELQIKNLRHDTDVASARLERKRNLQSLALDWEIGTRESGGHAEIVAGLMSNIHLVGLTLSGYRGNTLPSLDYTLRKLVMRKCPDCICLPPLHLFPFLQLLVLEDMEKLECVSKYVEDGDSIHSPVLFPPLQELRLTGLPQLRSWWQGVECTENHMFHCLSKQFIEDCPKLVSMPLFPTLEEGLVLDSCNLKPFQDTLNVKTEYPHLQTSTPADEASSSTSINALSSSVSPPLSNLKSLSIVGIEEFDNKKADGITWESLTSLQYLRLDYLPCLESLPDGMRHFTRLRELHIWRCSFTVLPEWIVNLKILKKLSICICPDLKSLPEKMGSLTSLWTLEIEDCPMLVHRCQRKAGADWDKISRIPDLRIDRSSRR